MIIAELDKYCHKLRKRELVPKAGWVFETVNFGLELDDDGQLVNILTLSTGSQIGKKLRVPANKNRTSDILPFLLCDFPAYFLGWKDGKTDCSKHFQASKKRHLEILSTVDCAAARAVCRFFSRWNPQEIETHPVSASCLKKLKGKLIFFYKTKPVLDDPAVQKACDEHYLCTLAESKKGICSIRGEYTDIAELHPGIIWVGKETPQKSEKPLLLVTNNSAATCSYAKTKGYNSSVSKVVAETYTTALNYLLSSDQNRIQWFDLTKVVFWSNGEPEVENIFGRLIQPKSDQTDGVRQMLTKISAGLPVAEFSPDNRICVLGMRTNNTRIAVQFWFRSHPQQMLSNIANHYARLDIVHHPSEPDYLTPHDLMVQVSGFAPTKQSDSPPKINGALTKSLLQSILFGSALPTCWLSNTLARVRAKRELNRTQAAIIKACLLSNKTHQSYQEVLTVSLNPHSDNISYVLGRLFAVLESCQDQALPNIKATIEKRFLSAALVRPASVFPSLLKNSVHHLAKIQCNQPLEQLISELIGMLSFDDDMSTAFPVVQSIEQQGIFLLGLYHQRKALAEQNQE